MQNHTTPIDDVLDASAETLPDEVPDDVPGDLDEPADRDPFEDIAGLDEPVDADGEPFPDEAQAELEALAAAELDAGSELEQALATAQREAAHHRAETQAALARYREAVLTAEPDLPPEIVRGETLEELDASIVAAREVVARVRDRVRSDAATRGFPTGAPAREATRTRALTAAEKIARGLEERG